MKINRMPKKDQVQEIALCIAGIDLTAKNSDNDDFHELHVDTIRILLEAAFEAGRTRGSKGRPNQK